MVDFKSFDRRTCETVGLQFAFTVTLRADADGVLAKLVSGLMAQVQVKARSNSSCPSWVEHNRTKATLFNRCGVVYSTRPSNSDPQFIYFRDIGDADHFDEQFGIDYGRRLEPDLLLSK